MSEPEPIPCPACGRPMFPNLDYCSDECATADTTSESLEYTPTTEQVEDGYAHEPELEWLDPVNYGSNVQANRRAFRRWLTAHDAEAARETAEKAWDEGERHESEYLTQNGQFCPRYTACNPYRAEQIGEE